MNKNPKNMYYNDSKREKKKEKFSKIPTSIIKSEMQPINKNQIFL